MKVKAAERQQAAQAQKVQQARQAQPMQQNVQARNQYAQQPVMNNNIPQQPVSRPYQDYYQETRREVKESFWTKLSNSKFMRAIKYAFKIRIRLQLPEGLPDGNQNQR